MTRLWGTIRLGACCLCMTASLALSACSTPSATPSTEAIQAGREAVVEPTWPKTGAGLKVLDIGARETLARKKRIYLDPGHGSVGNTGNKGCFCQLEEDFTLRVAHRLAADLMATGFFEVQLSRQGEARVDYQTRVNVASEWADAYVSLHSDARGGYTTWSPKAGQSCPRNTGHHGFSVLWSGEGDASLRASRKRLADGLSNRLTEAGFAPYAGTDYDGLYAGDVDHPGSFVDTHEPGQRILVLRRPTIPSVIIETHQALDVSEVARWREVSTLEAFSAAVTAGLLDAL
jgi:N-acetylmuramoyl-L-alanine amidase